MIFGSAALQGTGARNMPLTRKQETFLGKHEIRLAGSTDVDFGAPGTDALAD